MSEEDKLLDEADQCIEKLLGLRMPIYGAAHMAEEIGGDILGLCMEQGRMDLRYAMADIINTLQWLQEEILGFQPLQGEGISG